MARSYWEDKQLKQTPSLPKLFALKTCVSRFKMCLQAQHASLREMARSYWEDKRQKKSRLMKVDGHDVLRENNYDMQVRVVNN